MYYHHTKYSPSSRASDISRLLDPAYSPTTSTTSKAAYVDHNGNLHDPDFRHFPATSHYSPTKRRAVSINSAPYAYPRPQWELGGGLGESALDEDDDEGDSALFSRHNNRYSMYASPLSQSSRYASDAYSRTTPISSYSSYHYPSSTTYSYISSPTSCSPTSYSSEETALNDSPSDSSPLSDEPLPLHRRCVSRLRGTRTRQRSQSRDEKRVLAEKVDQVPTRRSIESARSETRTVAPNEEDEEEEPQEEYTPTCTQSLQRQWSCFALRWRLGVFRAKKKVRRRLSAVVQF